MHMWGIRTCVCVCTVRYSNVRLSSVFSSRIFWSLRVSYQLSLAVRYTLLYCLWPHVSTSLHWSWLRVPPMVERTYSQSVLLCQYRRTLLKEVCTSLQRLVVINVVIEISRSFVQRDFEQKEHRRQLLSSLHHRKEVIVRCPCSAWSGCLCRRRVLPVSSFVPTVAAPRTASSGAGAPACRWPKSR